MGLAQAPADLRVILVGGSSHSGKTTLGEHLAKRLGWEHRSTDYLKPHPGRPWRRPDREVPPHVAEHYATLSTKELLVDVLRHYRSLWPQIEAIIARHTDDPDAGCLVLEGSALWPGNVATLCRDRVGALWLTGDNELFRKRIRASSRDAAATADERALVESFIQRTLLYNRCMREAVEQHGLVSIDVGAYGSVSALAEACLARLRDDRQTRCPFLHQDPPGIKGQRAD